jgi:hypothetical protein
MISRNAVLLLRRDVWKHRALLFGFISSCEEPDARYRLRFSPDGYVTPLYWEVGIVAACARGRDWKENHLDAMLVGAYVQL